MTLGKPEPQLTECIMGTILECLLLYLPPNILVLFVENAATRKCPMAEVLRWMETGHRDEKGRFGDDSWAVSSRHLLVPRAAVSPVQLCPGPARPSLMPAMRISANPQLWAGASPALVCTHSGPLCFPTGYQLWGNIIICFIPARWFSRKERTFSGRS